MSAPEYRFDELTGRAVIIAPARGGRPIRVRPSPKERGDDCPFCAGHEGRTPEPVLTVGDPWRVRVVPNRFPAVDASLVPTDPPAAGFGFHEVVIESREHDAHFADLPVERIYETLTAYRDRLALHMDDPRVRWARAFKNEGAAAGASLPHVHSQVIALPFVPPEILREAENLSPACGHCDRLRAGGEVVGGTRLYAAVAPRVSRFPYELWLTPREHAPTFRATGDEELRDLAKLLRAALLRLRERAGPTPFNFVVQERPKGFDWHWRLEIIPRLTEMAGFELGSGLFINPLPPESAWPIDVQFANES